jgi:hypothetical protein
LERAGSTLPDGLMSATGLMKRAVVFAAVAALAASLAWALAGEAGGRDADREQHPAAREGAVSFERDISPLFESSCTICHGPGDAQSSLRLDSLEGVLAGGVSGRVVIPGDGAASPLVKRLTGELEPQMPLGDHPLGEEQIALIRAWIDQLSKDAGAGAGPRSTHWAYGKPVRPEIPRVGNARWVRNPIDAFVLARLEAEGLEPSPEAGRATLLRRVSLDVIGLPPTPEEVEAFLADTRPDAYERVVDRLLASPHYGERWARPWLDMARYADSHGFEKDGLRVAWKWRDWVIDALNRDLSFRDFTIEQIAGDMLPKPGVEQLVATGFHRNTQLNQEGGVDNEEARFDVLLDRVNTTATVWLGTTLACAQCHNHKYDPFSQKDYYRFLAFFDNHEYEIANLGQGEGWVVEPEIELPTPEQAGKAQAIRAEMAALEKTLHTMTPELEAAQPAWEHEMRRAHEKWTVLAPERVESAGGAALGALEDGSVLASGANPEADTYVFETKIPFGGATGLRIEVLPHESLPRGGPGRDAEGNFLLSRVEIEVAAGGKPARVALKEAHADEFEPGHSPRDLVVQTIWSRGWAVDPRNPDHAYARQVVLVPEKPFGDASGARLTLRLQHGPPRSARNLGRFRLSVTAEKDPAEIARLPAALRPVLEMASASRTDEQKRKLEAVYLSATPLLAPERKRLAELQQSLKDLNIVTAMVVRERAGHARPSTPLRVRGSFLNPGEKVYAGVPAALHPLPEHAMPNRLGLAYWLVDEENPLTARVTANRFWATIFGRGLVETSEDFGTQGARPSHPELLDWLATEFVREGWSMKKLVRLILTSATYRQSSRAAPELLERDPYNRLLARGPRFRVEAEMVRDVALAASGLLSRKVGGPSVFPFQPEGIWDQPYSDDQWKMSEGEDRYRRGIYTFIRRTSPYPSFTTFDAPSREQCVERRPRTNTPLQALVTLNDPAFFEAAQAMARRMVEEAPASPAARAERGFRLAASRAPAPRELARLVHFYEQQRARFERDAEAARKVTNAAENETPSAELAAWTMVANVLLNLDATLTKE